MPPEELLLQRKKHFASHRLRDSFQQFDDVWATQNMQAVVVVTRHRIVTCPCLYVSRNVTGLSKCRPKRHVNEYSQRPVPNAS